MTPTVLILLLLFGGLILLVGELFLPAGGVLGVLGGGAILAAVGLAFWVNQWIGAGLLLALLVLSPFAATAAMNLWPKTPYGRKIVLSPPESRVAPPQVTAGETGIAISELRPSGEIELAGQRIEAKSEYGVIRAGSNVRVIGVIDGCVVVRQESEKNNI